MRLLRMVKKLAPALKARKTKVGRGRPPVHSETWSKVSVVLFDRQIVDEKVAGECAYLRHPTARGFERPYGWAWLLKLAAALMQLPDPRWSATLAPLAGIFVEGFCAFLPKATYPVRSGAHFNTAFALALAADYAAAAHDRRPLFCGDPSVRRNLPRKPGDAIAR